MHNLVIQKLGETDQAHKQYTQYYLIKQWKLIKL